ncbi:FAD binding domain-containing protein [Eoetvoesiella caeni]|uniref:Carbon-monoxide dehydrogenase medium subunit n=1 Tax=Eoetvoesiella caeni TaxID=645616 RepID=A0A366HLP7_9BURK|nr:xanthine dehydrogenase family protein subunit M [Eoetvoesiella caeni]MCI2807221.1 xanthine dehydrogenase family protein subunit M [Eoetvoesiella caeni]NYT53382.1 xanthine dehydrogenase family protein subunit M [Eoetvoesiella caeni]RBP43366.1 carbon-monoxide dehydrogenase medium subunit [Eoetvoesiella caeni]
MRDFDYLEPTSVEEASRMLADLEDEEVRLIAGGTALILTLRQRMLRPQYLVSLAKVDRLHGIEFDEKAGLRIGALSRHADIAASPLVRQHFPVLASMAQRVANPQVRNQGTIGGNLCYGDPSTDPPSCLLALDASVVLGSTRGERTMPLDEFIVDYFETALEPDEVLLEIRVPPLAQGTGAVYSRFLRTAAEHRPLVSVAFVAHRDGTVCRDARIAVGATTPIPTRLRQVEAFLEGRSVTPAVAAEAADMVAQGIEPLSDSRGDETYRRNMVRAVARRSISELFELSVDEGVSA